MNEELLIRIRAEVAGFKRDIASVKSDLGSIDDSFKGVSTSSKSASTGVRGFSANTKRAQSDIKGFSDSIGQASIRLGTLVKGFVAFQAGRLALGAFRGSINAARELEEELISVQKTTGFADDQIKEYERSILQLSKTIPLAVTELAQIGVVAGQLGIGEEGVEAVTQFTDVIARAAIALPEFTGGAEQIATAVARANNVFGFGVEGAEAYLSTLNALANTTAANAAEITSFNNNFATTAVQLGITADEASALGATFVSLGISGDNAGTRAASGVNVLLNSLEDAESALGFASGQLQEVFENDGFLAGLDDVITAFGAVDSELDRVTISSEIFGLVGGRAFRALIGNLDQLDKNLDTANDGYREAISLQQEFEVAQNSFNSRLQQTQNQVTALQINFGQRLLPTIQSVFEDINSGAEGSAASVNNLAGVTVALAETFRNAGRTILFVFRQSGQALGTLAAGIVDVFGATLRDIGSISTGVGNSVVESFDFIGTAILNGITSGANSFIGVIEGTLNAVVGKLNGFARPINAAADKLGLEINLGFQSIELGRIAGGVENAGIGDRIARAFDGVGGEAAEASARFSSAMNEFGSSVIDDFSELTSSIDEGNQRISDAFSGETIDASNVSANSQIRELAELNRETIEEEATNAFNTQKELLETQLRNGELTQSQFNQQVERLTSSLREGVESDLKFLSDKEREKQELLNTLGLSQSSAEIESTSKATRDSAEEISRSLEEVAETASRTFDQYESSLEDAARAQESLNELVSDFESSTQDQQRALSLDVDSATSERVFELSRTLSEEQEKLNNLRASLLSETDAERSNELRSQIELLESEIALTGELLRRTADSSQSSDIGAIIEEQTRRSLLSQKELEQERFDAQQREFENRREILDADTIEQLEAIEEISGEENRRLLNNRIEKLRTIQLERERSIQLQNEVTALRISAEAQISSQRLDDIQAWGDEYIDILERAREIQSQINSQFGGPTFHTGGMIPGAGEVGITALGGEYVLRNAAVAALGKPTLDYINRFKTLPPTNNTSTSSNVTNNSNSKTIRGNVIINEAKPRRSDRILGDYFGY